MGAATQDGTTIIDAVTPVPPVTLSSSSSTSTSATATATDTDVEDDEIDDIEDDPREVWYQNRAERKIQIERTYGEMTRTALLLQKQSGAQNYKQSHCGISTSLIVGY